MSNDNTVTICGYRWPPPHEGSHIMTRLCQAIAKLRIKRLERDALYQAGRDIPPQQAKAQQLRKKHGLQNWQYQLYP
jgi:hypothetical protein